MSKSLRPAEIHRRRHRRAKRARKPRRRLLYQLGPMRAEIWNKDWIAKAEP